MFGLNENPKEDLTFEMFFRYTLLHILVLSFYRLMASFSDFNWPNSFDTHTVLFNFNIPFVNSTKPQQSLDQSCLFIIYQLVFDDFAIQMVRIHLAGTSVVLDSRQLFAWLETHARSSGGLISYVWSPESNVTNERHFQHVVFPGEYPDDTFALIDFSLEGGVWFTIIELWR